MTRRLAGALCLLLTLPVTAQPPISPNTDSAKARLVAACPGLKAYEADLSPISPGPAFMRGYEGGVEFAFKVTDKPRSLPPPLDIRAAGHQCSAIVDKAAGCALFTKRACLGICDGKWPDKGGEIELVRGGCSVTVSSTAIVDALEMKAIVAGLPLSNRQAGRSDNGRKKVTWSIDGIETGHFEVIGNDTNDLDQVAWHCPSFDVDGNYARPVSVDSTCGRLFVEVLRRITPAAGEQARFLLKRSGVEGTTVQVRIDRFHVETDGHFYSVRK